MKAVIIAATLAVASAGVHAQAPEANLEMLVFGKSFHTPRRDYNEVNPGLGLEYVKEHGRFLGGQGSWLVGGFVVHDSCRRTGGAAYGGYRLTYPISDSGVRFEATIRGGWLKDCDWNAPAALPSIGLGYKNFTLEGTYIPALKKDHASAVVIWARWRF